MYINAHYCFYYQKGRIRFTSCVCLKYELEKKKGRELCIEMTHYPLQLWKALLCVEAMGARQMKSLGLAII